MKANFLRITMAVLAIIMLNLSFTSCTEDDDDDDDNQSQTATLYEEVDGIITVTDRGEGTGTITWTADKVYILNGLVFVNEGQTLTIEAGTLIKGKPGQETDASALVIARGGMIDAQGTATAPIILTAEADNAEGTGVAEKDRGLWGGVIVLGAASLNSNPGTTQIEGIPTTEPRGSYGGSNDADNSGTLKYISIRHGGTDIGEGNEINGLTLGGVGSGTTIEYIEVVANKDDGVEFFGGMPNLKNILVAYVGDDCYDYDEGYRGKGQFWAAIQDADAGDRMGEHDGGTDPETAEPYAIPHVSNATYVGRGADAGKKVITFRDNAGGYYMNSIFANQAKGIDIELLNGDQDSYKQWQDGNLKIENNVFSSVADGAVESLFKIGAAGDSVDTDGNPVLEDPNDEDSDQLYTVAFDAEKSAAHDAFAATFASAGNTIEDLGLTAANPVPSVVAANPNFSGLDSWFTNVSYVGAFEPGNNWAQGWTLTFK
jgi:hypothetical protein